MSEAPIYKYPHKDGGVFESYLPLAGHQRLDVWFCTGHEAQDGATYVGQYRLGDVTIDVCCVGEMYWEYKGAMWRCADDLPPHIKSDEQLLELMDDSELLIDTNCWLEVVESESYEGIPCGSIDEAIEAAHDLALTLQ